MKIQDIELVKPVVVLDALNDMNETEKTQAIRFIGGVDVIDNGKIVAAKELNSNSIFGSEAVIEYRKKLGLPDVAVRSIPVNAVCKAANDFEILSDLIYWLKRIKNRNDRIHKLIALKAPPVILSLEYRMLFEQVELLLHNREMTYPEKSGTGENSRVMKSLIDRGLNYTFLINPKLFDSKLFGTQNLHSQDILFNPDAVTRSKVRNLEISEQFLDKKALGRLLEAIFDEKSSASEDEHYDEITDEKAEEYEEDYEEDLGRQISIVEENLILPIPIVVREALKDMNAGEREQAERFAIGQDILSRGKIKPLEDLDHHSLVGSEAIVEYRKFLRLPDVSFQIIPVKEIYDKITDIDTLDDITFFIKMLSNDLDSLSREIEIEAMYGNDVFLIFVEWCIKLQKRVEYLFDNNWNGKPIVFKAISNDDDYDDIANADESNNNEAIEEDKNKIKSHIGIRRPGDEDIYDYVEVFRSLKDIGFTVKKLRKLSEQYKEVMDDAGIPYE